MEKENPQEDRNESRKKRLAAQNSPYILDSKPGFLFGSLLYRLFGRVKYQPAIRDKLRQAGRDGTVVYIIKYRSSFDYLLYYLRFLRDRIPYPKIAFDLNMIYWLPLRRVWRIARSYLRQMFRLEPRQDPGTPEFFKEEIKRGTTALLFLVDEKGFSQRFVHSREHPLVTLLQAQQEMDRPIFLVPLTFLYELKFDKSGTSAEGPDTRYKDDVGVFTKMFLFFRYYSRTSIDAGQFINLKDRLPSDLTPVSLRSTSLKLSEELLQYIDRQRRITLGPVLKSRQEIREIVLDHPDMQDELKGYADQEGKPIELIRRKAKGYFDEIAGNYNITYVNVWDHILSFVFTRIFDRVQVDTAGLVRVREAARRGTLVYIPCHRSHIDYLLLSYVLLHHSMHPPRIAAGKNLSFWPMGYVFRNSGAFFIRRTFKKQYLYSRVFSRYLQTLLEYGYPVEFFIEGGRSRSGKMIIPKLGLLSIALDTALSGKCEDLIFVPAHIGYDHIMEEQYYLRELGGAEKKDETFLQMIQAHKFLRRRYGTVYLHFAEPISARDYLAGFDKELLEDKDTRRQVFMNFSHKLIHAINSVTEVTPYTLVAAVLLALPHRGFTASEIVEAAHPYVEYLALIGAPMMDSIRDLDTCVTRTLSDMEERRIIDRVADEDLDEETFFTLEDDKRLSLEYYKNSIIHHFVPAAFAATALLSPGRTTRMTSQFLDAVAFLRDILQLEFIIEERGYSPEHLSLITDFFERQGLIERYDNGAHPGLAVTQSGLRNLPLWANLTTSFMESYWIVLYSFRAMKDKSFTRKQLVNKIKSIGIKLHRRGQIRCSSALSPLSFQNALNRFHQQGIIFIDSSSGEDIYTLAPDNTVWPEMANRLRSFLSVT
ncbi:MAG: 1-acyl-sn-glycerol-3-phosphate acyltransferase [Deltaproteobacteria bacterium]|nr:1-acyl-sn-glycerol-3-phosphate acyltransferase [Deltaproteobacteria bacterium]